MKITIADIIAAANSTSNVENFEVNPFLRGIEFDVREVLMSKENKILTVKGKDLVSTTNAKLFENNNFIKLYFDNDRFGGDWMLTLTASGRKVLFYIFNNIHHNATRVMLNLQYIQEATGLSKTSAYAGVSELINNNIIAPDNKSKRYYYINLLKFFRGDRRKTVTDMVLNNTLYLENEINLKRWNDNQ